MVRRITERPREPEPSSIELAHELTAVECRALEAEASLVRERDAYALRVKDMEDKLRKIEPWVRRLREELQGSAKEREALHARCTQLAGELAAARSSASASATGSPAAEPAPCTRAEYEVALREAEAANAGRDAALAEAAALRQRLDNDLRTLQDSWGKRIENAEASRDRALDETRSLRLQLGSQRRADEEIRRLLKQVEQLERTTAAHKAVARAAQEEAEGLRRRAAELEQTAGKTADESKGSIAKAEETARKLDAAETELERLRAENAAATQRTAAAESALEQLRAESEQARGAVAERERFLGGARGEIATLTRTVEGLRTELAEARRAAERHETELAAVRRDLEAAGRELGKLRTDAATSSSHAQDEVAQHRREAAEQKERAEQAARAEERARAVVADLTEKLGTEQRAHAESRTRVHDLETRLDQAHVELADAKQGIEQARAAQAASENERANVTKSLEQEREAVSKRIEAAETSGRSQLRALERRFEADLQREKQKAAEAAAALEAARHDHELAVAELRRQRAGVVEVARRHANEILEALTLVRDVDPVLDATISLEAIPQLASEVPAVLAGEVPPENAESLSSELATTEVPDWDRLLSDVQALRSEVEELRQPEEPSILEPTPDPEPEAHAEAAASPAAADDSTDPHAGRKRRRK